MSLEKIGQLAVELHAATLARKNAKYDLREKYTEFCKECLSMSGFTYIDKGHQQYRAMQEFSKQEVDAYRRAQLNEYNLKRKLDRAVRSHGAKSRHASPYLVQGNAVQDGAV
jgi:hypothetical protein